MIKINLTPIEELENPLWWLPDALVLLAFSGLIFVSVFVHTDGLRNSIERTSAEQQGYINEINTIQADLDRFDDLNKKANQLQSKTDSLKRITESKVARYLPLILVESLQVLKPEGLWFDNVAFEDPAGGGNNFDNFDAAQGAPTDGNALGSNLANVETGGDFPLVLKIQGQSYENSIIAEFMAALKSTSNQQSDLSDIRTQLYFSAVDLISAELNSTATEGAGVGIIRFSLNLRFRERLRSSMDRDARISRVIDRFESSIQSTEKL